MDKKSRARGTLSGLILYRERQKNTRQRRTETRGPLLYDNYLEALFDLTLLWTATLPIGMDSEKNNNWYRVLDIQQNASQDEIKRAYHRALLRHHPDKTRAAEQDLPSISIPAIDTVLEAFRVLSKPFSREEYDRSLESRMVLSQSPKAAPRPANIVSLDEFEEIETELGPVWTHACRCGGSFVIAEDLLEQDVHLIGCDCCSEAVWVGYEAISQ